MRFAVGNGLHIGIGYTYAATDGATFKQHIGHTNGGFACKRGKCGNRQRASKGYRKHVLFVTSERSVSRAGQASGSESWGGGGEN